MYFFVYISISIGNHLHIFGNHDPFEVDYITHEKTSNKLFIHNKGKGINNLYSKRIHKWIIIIGDGGMSFSIVLSFFFFAKIWGGYIGSVL